jgi:hypothetical protein
MNPNECLEARIEKLEAQVRRGRVWSVSATVLFAVVLFASMQSAGQKEIEADRIVARELQIVDVKGDLRASLGPDNSNPNEVSLDLRSNDLQKGPMARIRVGEQSAQLDLGGEGLPAAVCLENHRNGASVSVLSRADEQDSAKVSVATLSTTQHSGTLWLARARKVHMDDVPGQPAGVSAIQFDPSFVLESSNDYRGAPK